MRLWIWKKQQNTYTYPFRGNSHVLACFLLVIARGNPYVWWAVFLVHRTYCIVLLNLTNWNRKSKRVSEFCRVSKVMEENVLSGHMVLEGFCNGSGNWKLNQNEPFLVRVCLRQYLVGTGMGRLSCSRILNRGYEMWFCEHFFVCLFPPAFASTDNVSTVMFINFHSFFRYVPKTIQGL